MQPHLGSSVTIYNIFPSYVFTYFPLYVHFMNNLTNSIVPSSVSFGLEYKFINPLSTMEIHIPIYSPNMYE